MPTTQHERQHCDAGSVAPTRLRIRRRGVRDCPSMPTSRSGPTKQERVYQDVRERILAGTYVPGFRIVIDALAEEFGVSALPVREAIRRLEAEGLVVFRPNVGAQVSPAEPGLFEEELSVLAVLEGYATALAAPLLEATDIARLHET